MKYFYKFFYIRKTFFLILIHISKNIFNNVQQILEHLHLKVIMKFSKRKKFEDTIILSLFNLFFIREIFIIII